MNAGDKVKGKVMVITDYGAFVEVAAGVEGLAARERNELEPAPAQPEGLPEGRPRSGRADPEHRPRRAQDELGHEATRQADPWTDIEFKYP
jgi:small subunit ribosomal protein S1